MEGGGWVGRDVMGGRVCSEEEREEGGGRREGGGREEGGREEGGRIREKI